MTLYSTELNVANENEPPSSDKVVRKLLRKRNKGKALVEPYMVLPSTTAPHKEDNLKEYTLTGTLFLRKKRNKISNLSQKKCLKNYSQKEEQ
ncbi:hypothetical protein Tco_1415164 [Tanacetum coccineum]